jgi:hypothetical protein
MSHITADDHILLNFARFLCFTKQKHAGFLEAAIRLAMFRILWIFEKPTWALEPVFQIWIRIGSGFNRVSGSGSGFGIRIRI